MAFRIGSAKPATQAGMGVAVGVGDDVGTGVALTELAGAGMVGVGVFVGDGVCDVQEQSRRVANAIFSRILICFMVSS